MMGGQESSHNNKNDRQRHRRSSKQQDSQALIKTPNGVAIATTDKQPPQRSPRQQQVNGGRHKRTLHPFMIFLRTMYWWILFPSLIYMAYSSLIEMLSISSSSSSSSSYTEMPATVPHSKNLERSERDLARLPSDPSSSSEKTQFDTYRQVYSKEGVSGMPGIRGGGSSASSSGTPNYQYEQEEPNAWWQLTAYGQDQENTKPSHPLFLVKLEKARLAMLQRNSSVSASRSSSSFSSSFSSWSLAKAASHQPVNFTNPILSLPTKHLMLHDDDKEAAAKDEGSESNTLLIMVLSSPGNFIKRQAIRETWAANTTNVLFVVGQVDMNTDVECDDHTNHSTDTTTGSTTGNITQNAHNSVGGCKSQRKQLQHSLEQEQGRYNDLLEIPFIDNYKLLPEKVVQMHQYITSVNRYYEKQQHDHRNNNLYLPPTIQWVAKVDDDMYARPKIIQKYLQKYNPHIPMVIGKVVPHSEVARTGKWAEPTYNQTYYPYWPQGSAGYVVSYKVAEYISEQSSQLHRYQGEDVSIGIWMDEYRKLQSHHHEYVTYIQAKRMITNEGTQYCGTSKIMMIGHDLSPEEQLDCHMQFETKTNHTYFVDDMAWLDDPAEWKSDIRDEESWYQSATDYLWGDNEGDLGEPSWGAPPETQPPFLEDNR